MYVLVCLLFLLLGNLSGYLPGNCLAEDTRNAKTYTRSWGTQNYIKDNRIYDRGWNLQGYIRGDRIYDTDWHPTGHIKGDRIYDNDWHPQGFIKTDQNKPKKE